MSGLDKKERFTIEDVILYIQNNEPEFLDDNGLLDSDYIRERFNLNPKQLSKVLASVEF